MASAASASRDGSARRVAPAVVVLASAIAYAVASAWLRNEAAGWAYRSFLFSRFDGEMAGRVAGAAVAAVRPSGAAWALAFAICCASAGRSLARLARAGAAEGPDRLAWALLAAIVPTTLLAMLGWPDGRGMLTSPALVGVAALIAVAAELTARRRVRAPVSTTPDVFAPVRGADVHVGWLAAPLLALALLAAAVVVGGITTVQGFDSFGYHLPLAARWLAHARLVTGEEASLNLFYPGNFELLLRWTMAAGGDHFAWLPSFASAAGCLYLLYRICREVGQPVRVSIVAATAAASLPLFGRLAASAYSDLFMVFALTLAVWALLRWARTGGRSMGLLATMGAGLGLAIGTKYSALPPAAVIVGCWAWRAFLEAPARRDASNVQHVDWGWIARRGMIVAVAGLAGCAYWYLRNAVEHGNPIFPVSVAGLNGVRMEYLIPRVPSLAEPGWRWAAYPWGDFEYRNVVEGGLGPAFAAAAMIGLLLAGVDRGARRSGTGVLLVVTVGSLILWMGTRNVVPRYGLFPLLLAFVFVGELWIAHGSALLRLTTTTCVVAGMLLTARGVFTDALYVATTGRSSFLGVRPLVDALPPSRILNAVGTDIAAPAGYEALGSAVQHDVITTYADAVPADVIRYRARYVLLQDSAVAPFAARFILSPAGGVTAPDTPPVSLWRVDGQR